MAALTPNRKSTKIGRMGALRKWWYDEEVAPVRTDRLPTRHIPYEPRTPLSITNEGAERNATFGPGTVALVLLAVAVVLCVVATRGLTLADAIGHLPF